MPGRNLSNKERKLIKLWDETRMGWGTTLRSIEISGGTGLRGLDATKVALHYPISAICGPNGVGKSTILQLAALAHHAPPNWYVCFSNSRRKRQRADRSYYVFPDFFVFGPGEQIPHDVTLRWEYDDEGNSKQRSFTKSANSWGRYNSRPERASDFMPITRIVPAYEFVGIRNYFKKNMQGNRSENIDRQHLKYLSYIMSQPYQSAGIEKTDKYWFEKVRTNTDYTAFNMGSGETYIVQLLLELQNMPPKSLLVIEEIELGLHPQALKRLVHVLTAISLSRKIQIICSTHSSVFLDELPRQARILLRRFGTNTEVIQGPSTRLALFEMSGEPHPELTIYCEDTVAESLIRQSLELNLRRRVIIKPVGSYDVVIMFGVFHVQTNPLQSHICIVDGDVTQDKIDESLNRARGEHNELDPTIISLPGNSAPELWALNEAREDPYLDNLRNNLGISRDETRGMIDQLLVIEDHHNLAFEMNKLTALGPVNSLECLMNAVREHPQLDVVREAVNQRIN